MADTQEILFDKKILIVDDDPEVREAIDQICQAEGALTQVVGDGQAAVDVCREDPPDLLIVDMMLPKQSGFLVLEDVKKISDETKIIMVTANEGRRHEQYALQRGVDAYLHKPVKMTRLLEIARELLDS